MGSYGVIKEALLVNYNELHNECSFVQKLVPSTVNGVVTLKQIDGGFKVNGSDVSIRSIYHGGAFGFSEWHDSGNLSITANIPGSGVKMFTGSPLIQNVNVIGQCVMCSPKIQDHNAPYTHLCLVVESPGKVFAESFS